MPNSVYQPDPPNDERLYYGQSFTVRCGQDDTGFPTGKTCAAPYQINDASCEFDNFVLCTESGNWNLGSLSCLRKF